MSLRLCWASFSIVNHDQAPKGELCERHLRSHSAALLLRRLRFGGELLLQPLVVALQDLHLLIHPQLLLVQPVLRGPGLMGVRIQSCIGVCQRDDLVLQETRTCVR